MSERPSRATAWISGLLLLSVALNCLLVGILAGRWLAPREDMAGPPAIDRPLTFGERMRRLPQAERDKFQAAMLPYRPQIRAARVAVSAARAQFRDALRHEPYDPAAMLAAMTAVRDKSALVQQRTQEAAAQAFAVLSPQSRQQLSQPYPPGQ